MSTLKKASRDGSTTGASDGAIVGSTNQKFSERLSASTIVAGSVWSAEAPGATPPSEKRTTPQYVAQAAHVAPARGVSFIATGVARAIKAGRIAGVHCMADIAWPTTMPRGRRERAPRGYRS